MPSPLDSLHVALAISNDTTPVSLDEETRALYNRAITDPESLTDEERRKIARRPPVEEEDVLCRQEYGFSMTELVAKAVAIAIANNDNDNSSGSGSDTKKTILTYKEANLLMAGVVPWKSWRLLNESVRMSEADRDLRHRATAAALTEEMKTAQKTAQAVQQRWWAVEKEARDGLNDDDTRNIRYAMHVPWQERVLESIQTLPISTDDSSSVSSQRGIVDCCGLVVFHDPERTALYKAVVEKAVYNGLHCKPMLVNEEAIAKFTLHWVEVPDLDSHDDNAINLSALRSRFQSMLANHEFPAGLRSDSFLYMDDEGLQSARPYLWLGEPVRSFESGSGSGPTPSPDTKKATETGVEIGPLKVDIKHIAPTLFARLIQRDLSGEAKRRPYRHTSELTMLHRAVVRYSRDNKGELDGIWPPPSRYM